MKVRCWSRYGAAGLLMAALLASAVPADAQGFSFINGEEAYAACENSSPAEQTQAIALALAELSRGPSAVAHLHTEGTLPHRGIRDQSLAAERDWPAARDLAVGFCVSGRPDFRNHALAILSAWTSTYHPDFNPIDETNIDMLFLAADLMADSMSPQLTAQWQAFSRNLAAGYLEQAAAKSGIDIDNWQSHRIKLASIAAYRVGDSAMIGQAESLFTQQLGYNIHSGGAVDDFAKRDALRYVVFDLEPLVTAALAAHNHGENWYGTPGGNDTTLASALSWLAPYARGQRTHREFMNSDVPFDYARKNAGEEGFSGTWNPTGAAELYLEASALDRQWAELAMQLNGAPKLWQRLMMGMP